MMEQVVTACSQSGAAIEILFAHRAHAGGLAPSNVRHPQRRLPMAGSRT